MAVRLLHVSDLHFGRPSLTEQVDEVEILVDRERFDAIVISGDVSQRTRRREFMKAREFIEELERHAPVFVVPGNHDAAWWMAPMGIGSRAAMFVRYRLFIRQELEPVLHIPGATIVGLNSAQGIRPSTLTSRLRDLSIVGAIRRRQWKKSKTEFDAAPAGDLKVLVFHHNLLIGNLSQRWGLASRAKGIGQAFATGAELVLCGHDHDEKVDQVTAGDRNMVVAAASTLTKRVRGDRPASINIIDADETTITVSECAWSAELRTFARAKWARFAR
jgi:3',5'-cyclic AMP phosphodiesterase CpdA